MSGALPVGEAAKEAGGGWRRARLVAAAPGTMKPDHQELWLDTPKVGNILIKINCVQ